jgi:Cu+-exporting ATPase
LRVDRPKEQAAEVSAEVPISELVVGDRVVILPGDRVPVDGRVVEGKAAVDEAMLTGEAMPVEKQPGSEVLAGTVNANGRMVAEVTRTGEATALANVIAAVQRAQTSRAGIQRLGDRVNNIFVPTITLIALVAGLGWGLAPQTARRIHDVLAQFLWHSHLPVGSAAGFIIAAGVLIVACPCAMGLATPAAIMASANTAARRGILIRDGIALEKAGRITAVVFDKTGTLTVGRPGVVAEKAFGQPRMAPNVLAAALARNSTHPVSRAIAELSADTVALADWQEIRGCGVQAMTRDAGAARLGSLTWLVESGADLAGGEAFISEWSKQGATLVGLTLENRLAGLFAMQDQLKAEAANVVAELRRQNLKIFLVTGDAALTAASIGCQAGIAARDICAGVRPEAKAEFVGQLQTRGERVAFVGDGINDAPALSRADLGIAVSRASDIAREAADIILLKSEIGAVPECLGLARATLRTIKQNLFWAFFYNAVGVPLAALGFISPVFCAVAMGGSDLIVIGNALRLLRWRRDTGE